VSVETTVDLLEKAAVAQASQVSSRDPRLLQIAGPDRAFSGEPEERVGLAGRREHDTERIPQVFPTYDLYQSAGHVRHCYATRRALGGSLPHSGTQCQPADRKTEESTGVELSTDGYVSSPRSDVPVGTQRARSLGTQRDRLSGTQQSRSLEPPVAPDVG